MKPITIWLQIPMNGENAEGEDRRGHGAGEKATGTARQARRKSEFVPTDVAFLPELGPTQTKGEVELALEGQIEVVGRSEAGATGRFGHRKVGEAQQLFGHEDLILHAEIHATHAGEDEHHGVDVVAPQPMLGGERLEVGIAIGEIQQIGVEEPDASGRRVAFHQDVGDIAIGREHPFLPQRRDEDVIELELRLLSQFPRLQFPRNQALAFVLPEFPGVANTVASHDDELFRCKFTKKFREQQEKQTIFQLQYNLSPELDYILA